MYMTSCCFDTSVKTTRQNNQEFYQGITRDTISPRLQQGSILSRSPNKYNTEYQRTVMMQTKMTKTLRTDSTGQGRQPARRPKSVVNLSTVLQQPESSYQLRQGFLSFFIPIILALHAEPGPVPNLGFCSFVAAADTSFCFLRLCNFKP